jgi:hypothetical protein
MFFMSAAALDAAADAAFLALSAFAACATLIPSPARATPALIIAVTAAIYFLFKKIT